MSDEHDCDNAREVRDCAWCGLPMEVVTRWTWRSEEHVTARCLGDHWYGGPLASLLARWSR